MGEPDEKYGTTFWGETQEQLEPVMFNLMEGEPQVGDKITAEEVLLKTSKKGTEYHRLKKVKIVDNKISLSSNELLTSREVAGKASFSPSESQINQILELVKENNQMLRQLTEPAISFGEEGEPMPPDFGLPEDVWATSLDKNGI